MTAWLLQSCLTTPAPTKPEPAEPAPMATQTSPLWAASDGDGAIGLVGDTAWYFQSRQEPYGVFTRGPDGEASPVRPIDGLPIIGQPDYWEGIPGGYLTKWDVPARINEHDGALSVGWQASAGRWWDARHIRGDVLLTARYRPDAAVVALSLIDGRELWKTPLPQGSQGVEFHTDATTLYVTWTEYAASAPTPTIEIPKRIRALDIETGAEQWTVDFDRHPGALTAGGGTVLAAFDADLHFIDGASGETTTVATGQRPHIYPGVLMADGLAFVALNDAVTAYAADGTRRWSHPTDLDGGPRVALGEHLFVTTRHRTVLALDPQTGTLAWEIGVGLGPYNLLVSDEMVLARSGSSAAIGLPADIPAEAATISGRVTIDCGNLGPVWVGPKAVTPDADGRYTATVTAAGILRVLATVGEPFISEGELRMIPGDVRAVNLRLDGSGTYTVPDLTIKQCEPD